MQKGEKLSGQRVLALQWAGVDVTHSALRQMIEFFPRREFPKHAARSCGERDLKSFVDGIRMPRVRL